MKSEWLDRWLVMIGHLAVLTGLILVAVELKQNRDAVRAQTRHELASEIVALLNDVAGDPQLASLILAAASGVDLEGVEAFQYLHRTLAMHRYMENVHYQYRQGLYDADEFAGQSEAWRASGYAQSPEAVEIWCRTRLWYSPDFRAHFDGLVEGEC